MAVGGDRAGVRAPVPIQSDERIRHLLEHASDGVVVLDRAGRIAEANPAACALLGYAPDELLALCIEDVVADEGPAEDGAASPRSEWARPAERRLRRKDGAVVAVRASARPLGDEYWQLIVREVSAREVSVPDVSAREAGPRLTADDALRAAVHRDGVATGWGEPRVSGSLGAGGLGAGGLGAGDGGVDGAGGLCPPAWDVVEPGERPVRAAQFGRAEKLQAISV
jgi:PAS domain S-box-containing protein